MLYMFFSPKTYSFFATTPKMPKIVQCLDVYLLTLTYSLCGGIRRAWRESFETESIAEVEAEFVAGRKETILFISLAPGSYD